MLQYYCPSLTHYKRLTTKEVKIGDLLLGNGHPIRVQTMTTTDTMDTDGTVAQTILKNLLLTIIFCSCW